MFPYEPLCAVPVEAFGGVSDAREVYTRLVGKTHSSEKMSVRVSMTASFPMFTIYSSRTEGGATVTCVKENF